MGIPSPAEIRAYRDRTGCSVVEAADHFYPGASEDDRPRAIDRIKKIFKRSAPPQQRQHDANRPPSDGSVVDGLPRPAADYERARLDRVAFLEWHLAESLADLAWVRASGLVGRIPAMASQVVDARSQLDLARGDAGRKVPLDRNPGAVASEVERRQKRIAQLVAAQRAKERDL